MANVQDIVFILMQSFSGAVAGYITNKYAVNMIFRDADACNLCLEMQ